MIGHEAPGTEIPDDWIQQFEKSVAYHPTARAAWEEIKSAGLQEWALFLLYGYAGGADAEIQRMHQRTVNANNRIRAAIRSEVVAQTTTPARADDPALFRKRAEESRELACS